MAIQTSALAASTAPLAELNDGLTARRVPVVAFIEGDRLVLSAPDGTPLPASLASWPLADLRRLPEPGWRADELRMMVSETSDIRVTLRDPALIRDVAAAAPTLRRMPRTPGGLQRALATWALVAVGAIAAIVFVAAPLLADRIAEAIPPEREIALGDTIADQITQEGVSAFGIEPGVCAAPAGAAALQKLVDRLSPVAGAHVPLRVEVLGGDLVNAFALPGGRIFLMEGLINNAASAEEVAGVMAHEIGHVVARDPTRAALRSIASGAVVAYVLGDVVGGIAAAGLVSAVIDASHSRDAEWAADRAAVQLLEGARLPAEPFADFFARLRVLYGEDEPNGYLSTHPMSSEREAAVRRSIVDAPGVNFRPVLTDAEWRALRSICD